MSHPIFQLMHDACLYNPITLTLTSEYVDGEGVCFTAYLSDVHGDHSNEYMVFRSVEEALDEAIKQYREAMEAIQ